MKRSTLILMLCVWITSCEHQPSQQYDLLIKNANIIDGSGGNPYMADIAINGDYIVEIGNLGKNTATLIIDAKGRAVEWQKGSPHQRNYGTYPRTLALYTREKSILTLPEAARKMTSLPASRMNLNDRGLLAKDYKADIVIWDPATVQDNSTYVDPHRYSTGIGIDFVIVNGILVVIEGVLTGARPSHALKNKILRKNKI
jgi:N-acyl-D-aspartate/D-glutamate deacylase